MKKIEKLFNSCIRYGDKYFKVHKELDSEIISVYGFHYSDQDMDFIIDALDYGQGGLTFEEFHKRMVAKCVLLDKRGR